MPSGVESLKLTSSAGYSRCRLSSDVKRFESFSPLSGVFRKVLKAAVPPELFLGWDLTLKVAVPPPVLSSGGLWHACEPCGLIPAVAGVEEV